LIDTVLLLLPVLVQALAPGSEKALAPGPEKPLAQSKPDYIALGFDHYYNLEYDQAISAFDLASQADPSASEPHYHVAQTILYREMFRSGALETDLVSSSNSFLTRPRLELPPDAAKRFDAEAAKAMDLAQARIAKNANDVQGLYDSCTVSALRSNYDFLVRKAWKDALRDATAARRLCTRVMELDTSNYDARLVPALHEYVVGSLPWYVKSIGFLAGFHGDKDRGLHMLEEVAAHGKRSNVDAEFLLTALYRRENQVYKAIPLIAKLQRRYPRNYLLGFEMAEMYGAAREKGNALASIDRVVQLKTAGVPGYALLTWQQIWYEKASIQFAFGELDPALENYRKALDGGKDLNRTSTVITRIRMGQIHDLKNQREQALEQYRKAIDLAPDTDLARESKRYIDKPFRRISF
jgi:tetratricopeptide (TPR) repeat protein